MIMSVCRFFKRKIFKLINRKKYSSKTDPIEVEKAEQCFYIRYLKYGMTVFDVGANIGYSDALINTARNTPNKIYCFEGEKEYLNYFKENTVLEEHLVLFGLNIILDTNA